MVKRIQHLSLVLLILALIGTSSISAVWAQEDSVADRIVLVYNNLQDSLVVYDGSTALTTDLITADDTRRYEYELSLSPNRENVAVYTVSFEKGAINRAEYFTFTYTLDVFSLPDGNNVLTRELIPPSYVFRTGAAEVTPGNQTFELPEALGEMQWSPDGQQLAWVEGQDGAEANIHIWDAASGEIVELPDETGYPSRLRWSPDGTNIAYVAIETFLSDDGPTSNVIYIADTDGSSSAATDVSIDSQHLWLIDWIDNTSFVWSPFDRRAGALGLYLYNVNDRDSIPLVDTNQPISVAAWDAISEILAFAVPVLDRSEEAPPQPGLSPGAYVIRDPGQTPEMLLEADNLYGVDFTLPGYLAVGNDIVVRLDNNEQLLLSELRRVDYSPDGLYALGERSSQTFVRDLRTAEENLVVQLYYLDGVWLDNQNFIAQVGAYGSVIGIGSVDGSFTNLVEDVGNGPFEGFITATP